MLLICAQPPARSQSKPAVLRPRLSTGGPPRPATSNELS